MTLPRDVLDALVVNEALAIIEAAAVDASPAPATDLAGPRSLTSSREVPGASAARGFARAVTVGCALWAAAIAIGIRWWRG